MEKKVCSRCKKELSICNFYKNKSREDGYGCYCKGCFKEYRRNNQRCIEYSKEYSINNSERRSLYHKERYLNNKEDMMKKNLEYYYNNKDIYKEYTEKMKQKQEYRDKMNAYAKDAREKCPEKVRARGRLRNSIISGNIVRPEECQICFNVNIDIQGHHEDYSKPLDVIWCCRECHAKIHSCRLDNKRKKVYNDIINKMKG